MNDGSVISSSLAIIIKAGSHLTPLSYTTINKNQPLTENHGQKYCQFSVKDSQFRYLVSAKKVTLQTKIIETKLQKHNW